MSMMQADLFFKGSKVFHTISSYCIFAINLFLMETEDQRLRGNPEPEKDKEIHPLFAGLEGAAGDCLLLSPVQSRINYSRLLGTMISSVVNISRDADFKCLHAVCFIIWPA